MIACSVALNGGVSPEARTGVPYITAHARVEILQEKTAKGAEPLAIAESAPVAARVYYVNEDKGNGDEEARIALATVRMRLGDLKEAKAELERLSPRARNHPDVLEIQWSICVEEERWQDALEVARTMVNSTPERSSGWLHQAYALRRVPDGSIKHAWRALLPACETLGIGFLPYFPLASGLLTGKYRRGEARPEGSRLAERDEVFTDETFDRLEALESYAAERGISLLDVAIGGLLGQPAVGSVISGATKPEQVRANAAAGDWQPSAEDLAALDALR